MMGYAEWIFAPLPFLCISYALKSVIIACTLFVFPSNVITQYIDKLLKYGKMSSVGVHRQRFAQSITVIEVPKRYFAHFYAFASISCTSVAMVMFCCCCFKVNPPVFVMNALDFLASESRLPLGCTNASVSVFSDAKMNIMHYCIGMAFYTMAALSILAETPGFNRDGRGIGWKNDDFELHWYSIAGVVLYFWMVFYQYQCSVSLSTLRKDEQGCVQSHAYKVPTGYLFDNVSCPHYLAEIGIYFSLNVVLGFQSILYWFIFMTINQTVAAIWTHQWYLANYPKYPKNRKAIFPFLL